MLRHWLIVLSSSLSQPFIWLIKGYKFFVSPLLPNACRYTPTCSQYGIEAFKKHGVFFGLLLTLWRILRCNPWGGHGYDPVPDKIFRKKSKT